MRESERRRMKERERGRGRERERGNEEMRRQKSDLYCWEQTDGRTTFGSWSNKTKIAKTLKSKSKLSE